MSEAPRFVEPYEADTETPKAALEVVAWVIDLDTGPPS